MATAGCDNTSAPTDHFLNQVPHRCEVKSWPAFSVTVRFPPPMWLSMMSEPLVPDLVIAQ